MLREAEKSRWGGDARRDFWAPRGLNAHLPRCFVASAPQGINAQLLKYLHAGALMLRRLSGLVVPGGEEERIIGLGRLGLLGSSALNGDVAHKPQSQVAQREGEPCGIALALRQNTFKPGQGLTAQPGLAPLEPAQEARIEKTEDDFSGDRSERRQSNQAGIENEAS